MVDAREEPEPVDGASVTVLAERVLRRERPGATLGLVESIVDHPGYRHAVFRCTLADGGDRRAVVVKRANDPASTVTREADALRLLARFPATRRLVPELLAHAPEHGLLVLEDLGRGPRLKELLLGDDPAGARAALVGWMRAMASVHGVTHHEALHGRPTSLRVEPRPDAPLGSLGVVPKRLHALGIDGSDALDQELRALGRRRHTTGWSTALTLQDIAPSNVMVDGSRVRLYDLEFAGFRSALVDGSYPFVRVFRANDTGRLPIGLREELARVYRSALAEHLPEAADDELYGAAHADALVVWTASALARLPKWLKADRLRFRATERQRLLAALDACVSDPDVTERLPHVHRSFDALTHELQRRWDSGLNPMPPFPCLAAPERTPDERS